MAILTEGRILVTDASDTPINGGKVRIYNTGTTTLTSVFSDADLSVPLTNPVVANSSGFCPVIFGAEGTIVDITYLTPADATVTGRTYTAIPLLGLDIAGLEYARLSVAQTWTAKQTLNGSTSVAAIKLLNALEKVTITGAAVSATTINFDLSTQSVVWYNVNATGNPTAINFRMSSGTALNDAMSVGESITCAMMIKNGATAYFLNSSRLTVDTSGTKTVLWQISEPIAGGINSTDLYSFVITKTANATWTIFASATAFV
jgi:hypothetical protein